MRSLGVDMDNDNVSVQRWSQILHSWLQLHTIKPGTQKLVGSQSSLEKKLDLTMDVFDPCLEHCLSSLLLLVGVVSA